MLMIRVRDLCSTFLGLGEGGGGGADQRTNVTFPSSILQ
jgi:hypothetical protein